MSYWFAVMTKPRAESIGCAQLERQGFECRLPRIRRERRSAKGMREVIEPLFPRYLFLHADPDHDDLARVRSTRGVCGLVRFGAEPARVPERVIDALTARSDSDGMVRLDLPQLRPGDAVRVQSGALAGIDGVFRGRTASDRVRLLVRLLGEQCDLVVPLRHIALQI